MNSSKRNISGPATSTVPFNGESKAARLTALATSAAEDGLEEHRRHARLLTFCRLLGGASCELEELRGANNRVRDGRLFNELLLRRLRAEIAVLWKSVAPNDGQRNVVSHPPPPLRT